MICSQIYAAFITISICLARAAPGHGGGIGGGDGGGGVGGHGGGGHGVGGAHGGGGFGGFAASHNGIGGRGGSGGIYLGRPYYGHDVKRDVSGGRFEGEGVFLPWPVFRDYYDYY